MFAQAIKSIGKSMFPIIRISEIQPAQWNIGVVGTGFCISADGSFVTAAHIFDDAPANSKFYFWGRLPEEVKDPATEIQEIARDDDNDIFIGRIAPKVVEALPLSETLADIGRTVCIAGYPLAVVTLNAQGGPELGGVRRYYQPTFVLDHGQLLSKSPQGKERKHDGLLLRDFGLYGMSGGAGF